MPLKIYPKAVPIAGGTGCELEEFIQVVLLILLALTSGVAILLGVMVVGLMEAPWPILLSVLFMGLFGLQRLAVRVAEGNEEIAAWRAPANVAKGPPVAPEAAADDRPTFTYRGIKYHPSALTQPPTDEPPTITEGVYRGQRWQRASADAANPTPASGRSLDIKYRGHRVKPEPEPDESGEA